MTEKSKIWGVVHCATCEAKIGFFKIDEREKYKDIAMYCWFCVDGNRQQDKIRKG